jgi:hypothetical protein
MKSLKVGGIVISVCALVLASASAPASAKHHCKRVGASATAVTKEVSKALAKEALYQSNLFAGRKGRGHVDVSCKYLGVFTKCTARQVACK